TVFAIFPVTLVVFASDARAEDAGINWGDPGDPNQTIIQGTGCNGNTDAHLTPSGNSFSVQFTNLGVNLSGSGSGAKACTVNLTAVTIPTGWYPSQIVQTYTYGEQRTGQAAGSLSAQVSLFGSSIPPLDLSFPAGGGAENPGSRSLTFNGDPAWR